MIYLDHAAGTPMDEAAAQAMAEASVALTGHCDSIHWSGRRIRAALELAREQVASYVGCPPAQVILCDSTRTAFEVALQALGDRISGSVVTSELEHPRVMHALGRMGRQLHYVPMPGGEVDEGEFSRLAGNAELVVLSALNPELGTAPRLEELHRHAPTAWWLIDAVQAAAWLGLRPMLHERALVVVASHKLGGPPGPAALVVPTGLTRVADDLASALGAQVPWLNLIGFGAACAARQGGRRHAQERARALALKLTDDLRDACAALTMHQPPSWLGPILSVTWPGVSARALASALDLRYVAISRGSACRQKRDDGSAVVAAAFPADPERARTTTRWSLGWHSTSADIEGAVRAFRDALPGLAGTLDDLDRL